MRTPFQRDRDRIVHSKPFRRLKQKTQVFIDPAGDHYRTRMTHTLETTGISRVVARALRLNEDLTEAIGLGHDMGHPPFGHAGEERSTRCLRSASDRLPPQRAVAADRRGAEPDGRGAGRHPHAHRPASRDARGQDRAARRPGRLHQPRHRRRDPLRAPRGRGSAARGDRAARGARLAPDRHARPRPRRASERPATSSRATRSARRCSRCASFMFERVYLGPHARGEHERAPRRSRGSSITSSSAATRRTRSPTSSPDDRPLRAGVRRAALWRGSRTHRSGGQGRGRHGRGRLRPDAAAQGRRALHGPLPVPRGADAELLGQPGRQALPLLRLRQGGRRDHVRPRDREPRLRRRGRVAGRALPRHARVRGDVAAARGARKRRDRLHAVLDQAAAFYERHLWETAAGAPVREYLAEPRASARRSAASSGSASRRASGLAREGAGEGLHARRAARRRARRTRAATTTSRSG